MYKLLVTILFSGFFLSSALAQEQDTTYFDEYWSVTTKHDATYYRPAPTKEKDGYRIKDYYLSGALQMNGFSSSATEDLFEGEVIWYYESGQTEQQGTYTEGSLNGPFVSYDKEGHLLAEGVYQEGQPFEGQFYRDGTYYQILDNYTGGELTSESITDYAGGSKASIFWENKGDQSKLSYYGKDGSLIGESTWDSEGNIQNGLSVIYAYEPMVPLMLTQYHDGLASDTIRWLYASGELKKITLMDGDYQTGEIYYNREGKEIGNILFQVNQPYSGTYYIYHEDLYQSKKADLLVSKETYQDGVLNGPYSLYDEAGKVKETGVYKKGVKDGEVLFYSPKGAVAYKGTYKMGEKINGTFLGDQQEMEVYEKGLLKESRTFYSGGVRLQSMVKTGLSADYYDSLGKSIGHLMYKNQQPYEGLEIDFYENAIVSESEYHAGHVIRKKEYDWQGIPQTEYFYSPDGNYTGTASFYSTGEKKTHEKTDENYYSTTIFFDKKGNEIGKLRDAEFMDGDQIEFSGDQIIRITRYKHSGKVYEKRLLESGKVLYEIDYYGKASFYNEAGHLLSTATYKDEEPFEGVVYIYDEYSDLLAAKVTYQNGVQNGEYEQYAENYETGKSYVAAKGTYANGMIEGIWIEYAPDHQVSSATYKAGMKEGKATFYSADGSVLSEVMYKADLPYSGAFYTFDEYGDLSTIAHYAKGAREGTSDTYYSGQLYSRDVYHLDELTEQHFYRDGAESNKLTYKNSEPYDGVAETYSTLSYYKKGKLMKESVYSDYDFQVLSTETVYDEHSDQSTTTTYFSNGEKQSVVRAEAGVKNGEASYFSEEGSLLGTGTYENDLPIAGSFIYYNYYDSTSYLEVEVNEWTISATVYEEGAIKTSLVSKLEYLATEVEKNEHIMQFYQMLSCSSLSDSYTLDYFY